MVHAADLADLAADQAADPAPAADQVCLAADHAAAADPAAGEATATSICAGCHMPDGNSVVDMFPKIAGQHEQYIVKQINDYKSGARQDDQMTGMAFTMATDADVENVAAYFAAMGARPMLVDMDPQGSSLRWSSHRPQRPISRHESKINTIHKIKLTAVRDFSFIIHI